MEAAGGHTQAQDSRTLIFRFPRIISETKCEGGQDVDVANEDCSADVKSQILLVR